MTSDPRAGSVLNCPDVLGSAPCILAVNGGSSSIKFALFRSGELPTRLLSGTVERIGLPGTFLRVAVPNGVEERQPVSSDLGQTVAELIAWLDTRGFLRHVAAVGHRVVHGGPLHFEPCLVTSELVHDLRLAGPLDPNHLPGVITLIDVFDRQLPGVPQVACFDTAFHRDLPLRARTLPIPRRYQAKGLRRFGFHGLSYAYLMAELERLGGPEAAQGRVILAHLGSGASMAAVLDGRCMDTTMGLTPAGGLVMGTRSGDLDPGVLLYLLRTEGLTIDQLDELVNHQSGLIGLSETTSDMRDLLEREDKDVRAAEALELFCYQARKWIGALAAAIGGLDTLVFAGGVGENAPAVRARICDGLEFLGVHLDSARNAANADCISRDASRPWVRVIPVDEEVMIARSVRQILDLG